MAECDRTGNEVELEEISEGVLRCPDCGVLLDLETLEELGEMNV